jgi:hypothetical protein
MDRYSEMLKMRSELLTYQDIGNRFGISRERVRQIIGNTGRNFRLNKTIELSKNFDLTKLNTEEIGNLPGLKKVWENVAKSVHHVNNGQGSKFEELANKLLKDNGIENVMMGFRHPFDILTKNGKRIDVKHTDFDVLSCPSQKYSPASHYSICHLKGGRDCDFFFAMVPDKEELIGYAVFIIPSNLVPKSEETRIRIPWPPSNKPSKWHEFHERYDLLR